MNKYKAIVYPYQRAFAPFISRFAGDCNCEIKALVSPKGFPYINRDAACADLRDNTGFIVSADFEGMLQQADSLLIPEGDYIPELYSDIIKKAIIAAQAGKHILCAHTLENKDDEQLLSNVCILNNVDFVYARQLGKDNLKRFAEQAEIKDSKSLYRPESSVIFVGEIFENTNAKDIVLILEDYFSKSGYKMSIVMEPGFSQIMGFHGTDELFDNENLNVVDNITAINEYFENLEKLEQPDIILVQIPGGMMKFNDIINNSYGAYAYMLSQAIVPDCFVCCLPFDEYYPTAAQTYSDLFDNRFGYPITCMHISNLFIDPSHLMENYELDMIFLPMERINSYIKENMSGGSIPVINALEYEGQQILCKKVKEALVSYSDATAL